MINNIEATKEGFLKHWEKLIQVERPLDPIEPLMELREAMKKIKDEERAKNTILLINTRHLLNKVEASFFDRSCFYSYTSKVVLNIDFKISKAIQYFDEVSLYLYFNHSEYDSYRFLITDHIKKGISEQDGSFNFLVPYETKVNIIVSDNVLRLSRIDLHAKM